MKHHIPPVLLIVIISMTLYANTLNNGFVYDDFITLVGNTFINNLNNLSSLFRLDVYFASSGELTYRPIVTFTYLLDYAMFGLNPWGFHLVNTLLHVVNGVLLYTFLYLLIRRRWVSFISTLIFVTHPALTEAVNAVSYREDLLAFLFYMTALNLFLTLGSSSGSRGSLIIYPLSCLSYLLALFSKEMAVTLPLIIFIYEWSYAKKPELRSLLSNYRLIGLVIITLIYLLLRFTSLYNPFESGFFSWKLTERLYTIPWILLNYLKLISFPVSLSADHVFRPIASPSSPFFLLPLAAIIVSLVMVFRIRKREKEIAFGASFFFFTLLPVYNIIPLLVPFAERYLYLPMAGIAIIAGGLINFISKAANTRDSISRNIAYLIPLAAIFAINSMAVVNRNSVWKNNKSLCMDASKKSPESSRIHNELGLVYHNEGQLGKAIDEFETAIKINPGYSDAYTNLGIAYHAMGRLDNAMHHLKEAVRLNPYHYGAHFGLGLVYYKIGRHDEAIQHYMTAIRLNPLYSMAHNNLGLLYAETERFEEAIRHFKTAIMLEPAYITPRKNLADLYFKRGEYGKVIDEYMGILKINPSDPTFFNNLGVALFRMGRLAEAMDEFQKAIRLKPDYTEARHNLELVLKKRRGNRPTLYK